MDPRPGALHTSTPAELKARRDAEQRGTPFLEYRDGGGAQRLRELPADADRISIGRREEADVPLPWDEEVSRLHAVLERVAGDWTVVDDGLSHNGTFLGTERIAGRRRLRDHDVLRIGATQITYRDPAAGGSRVTAAAAPMAIVANLTDTQRQVLVALCRPLLEDTSFATPATNQQIADQLFMSVDAVKGHLRVLFEKFAVVDVPQNAKRAQLVERAIRTGIVTARDLR